MILSLKKTFRDAFLWILGSTLFSVSVNMFSAPNNIVQGGLTGIGTVVNYLFPKVPIGSVIFVLNIPLIVLAWKNLKGTFLIKTFCATAIFSLFIDLGARVIAPYTGDKLLSCVFCGVLSGAGLALVFITGATTGGTDIIAMLLKKNHPRLSMGKVILFTDLIVVLLSYVVYGEIESVMYAIIIIFLSSRVIDTLLYGSDHSKLVMIITEKESEVLALILCQIGRGATVVQATGGYTFENKKLILCAAKKTQISNLLHLIAEKDPKAFTIVCDAGEISGEGFNV